MSSTFCSRRPPCHEPPRPTHLSCPEGAHGTSASGERTAHTGQRGSPEAVTMDSGLILLVFLAFLFAWGLNRVRRALRLGPLAYAGVMIAFVIVMLAVWGQTMR
ncbi:hypothetical protein Ppa06_12810 [Planomonospora parontospora subsp. parontospora]|nr:hypothetical protein GCM10010126_12770 [Planomonospora parontospora]GII07483.1 hypothetical protein Ppa06_12810 [Planomonospora parontospora subsp. parontospora]